MKRMLWLLLLCCAVLPGAAMAFAPGAGGAAVAGYTEQVPYTIEVQAATPGGNSSAHAAATQTAPDWNSRLLSVIANPNVAYILLLIGIYGLIFEIASPGFILPGLTGGVSLLLGIYALQVMSIDYVGLALMGLGVALMVAEVFVPVFALMGIGGVIAFTVGSVMLFDRAGMYVSLPLIGGAAAVSGSFLLWMILRLLRLRRRRPMSGAEELLGSIGVVIAPSGDHVLIRLHGERWTAIAAGPLAVGQKVRVIAVDGLRLTVEPEE
ncbi:NfeD family protein [Acidihalobacter ferrooxydans]|uniref:Uncharacterized protein n=1 Tax=Acidihalobacter ferrooxydans TaxID=1765967 RepID=A0A1P8UEX3_9GAMM|nr:NfeD family protein [Acidihalobacter ferrooxydans]APZ42380.1 hypothetical protein BW247_04140 [Acidihalobacter ferrooxydans]